MFCSPLGRCQPQLQDNLIDGRALPLLSRDDLISLGVPEQVCEAPLPNSFVSLLHGIWSRCSKVFTSKKCRKPIHVPFVRILLLV